MSINFIKFPYLFCELCCNFTVFVFCLLVLWVVFFFINVLSQRKLFLLLTFRKQTTIECSFCSLLMDIFKTCFFGSQRRDGWGELVFLRWVTLDENLVLTSEELLRLDRNNRIILNVFSLLHIVCLTGQQPLNRPRWNVCLISLSIEKHYNKYRMPYNLNYDPQTVQ